VHQFVRKLITEWRRLELPAAGETVVIGVSGGADSLSLLLGMTHLVQTQKLSLRIIAAHFNHGLRGQDSDADEEFVRTTANTLEVEFATKRGHVSDEGNLEQAAREARYDFLRSTAASVHSNLILTGHTINDQAETFLMNLIRGSGIGGLAAMPSVRETELSGVRLVRPLLNWASRENTEGFCVDSRIEYRYDTMNDDTAFKRVRIRRILLPLLADMNPNIVANLAETAARLRELIPADAAHSEVSDSLSIADLVSLDEAVSRSLIRVWLGRQRGTLRALTAKHIAAVDALARSHKSGRVAEIPAGRVVRSGGKLTYLPNKVEKPAP
jgi:tRNA(Ile)-lysidine synthase